MAYDDVKREVAIGNRVMSHIGLAHGVTLSLGHVSLRVPGHPDLFVVKGRGYAVDALPAMKAADMIVCNLDGEKVEGPDGSTQCYEVKIHSAIFKRYPEVQSVIHAHPRHAVLMSILGSTLRPMCQEGSMLVRKPLPVWPHSRLVSTDEDGEGLAELMAGTEAALLIGHGVVCTGASISQAVTNMYQLEEQARMNYLAFAAMGDSHPSIPEELVQEQADLPQFWQLPHFQSAIPTGTSSNPHRNNSGQSGPYRYWASQIEEGV